MFQAQADHPVAFGTGQAGGAVSSWLLTKKAAGALPGIRALGPVANDVASTGISAATGTATRNISPFMSGDLTPTDYALSVLADGVGSVVGSAAANGVTNLGTKVLFKTGLQHSRVANAINQGVGGGTFTLANAGTKAALDPNYNPTGEELTWDALVSFGFQTITAGLALGRQSKAAKAALDREAEALKQDLYTLKTLQENGYITNTDFVDGMKARSALLRNTLNTTQYIGHGKEVKDALAFLDQLDDFVTYAEAYNNAHMFIGRIVPNSGGVPGVGITPSGGGVVVPSNTWRIPMIPTSPTMPTAPFVPSVAAQPVQQKTASTGEAGNLGLVRSMTSTLTTKAKTVAQEVVDRYVDHSIAKSRFVKNPIITDEVVEDLQLGEADDDLVAKMWLEYGLDIAGKEHVLTDNDIRHMYNRHGPHTPEAFPVTAEDIKKIPTIIAHYDEVYYLPRKDGKAGLMYQYRHNGTTFFLEQLLGDKLTGKQMIKVPTGTIPDVEGLAEAVKAKSINPLPDDAAQAVPQMYARDVRSDAFLKTSIPQTPPSVKPSGGIATALKARPKMTGAEAQALYQPFMEAYAKAQLQARIMNEAGPLVEYMTKLREDAEQIRKNQDAYAKGFAAYEAEQGKNQIVQVKDGGSTEPGKPKGKTELTKSDDGSTIGEQRDKKITAITDATIRQIPKVKVEIPGWTAEQCETINHWHRELLEYARAENEGKEVAFALYPGQAQPQRFKGEEGSLKFKEQLQGTELIVMHNHPRNHSFSDLDIAFFLGHDKIRCLTIVKHNGGIELLIKTDEYDHRKALTEFKRSLDEHVKGKTDKQIAKAIYEFLRKGKGGLKWIKIDGGN